MGDKEPIFLSPQEIPSDWNRKRKEKDEICKLGNLSESESECNDGSSYRSKKSKTDLNATGIMEDLDNLPSGSEYKSDAEIELVCLDLPMKKEISGIIKELGPLINRVKENTFEMRAALNSNDDPRLKIFKSKSIHNDTHLKLASSLIRSLDLIDKNLKLKSEILNRSASTQCSPTFIERNDGSSRNKEKQIKKKDNTEIRKGQELGLGNENRKNFKISRLENDRESDSNQESNEGWMKVERKKREEEKKKIREAKKKELDNIEKKKKELEALARIRKLPSIPKTDAIIVKTIPGKSYADIFKTIKKEAADKINCIKTVRKSRGGDLIIELEKDSNTNEMENTVKCSLGLEFKVRKLAPKIALEIKDLDPTLDKEEIKIEFSKALQLSSDSAAEIEVRNIRFGFGGTLTAIVSVPADHATKILQENKIKIGYTQSVEFREL